MMMEPRDAGADTAVDAPADAGFRCAPDVLGCAGEIRYRCGSDGRSRLDEMGCPEACDARLGCVTCVPGSRRCDGDVSMLCLDDGSRWTFGRDCADWGSACGVTGYCDDACAESEAARSYVGCEYWASPLANDPSLASSAFDFRLVVANPGRETAEITITRGAHLVQRESVPPGAAVDIVLPWIDEVSFAFRDDQGTGVVVEDGAYRARSSHPVVIAQFNPFHYAALGGLSHTNDASLLLPAHALGTEHVGLSYLPRVVGRAGTSPHVSPGYLALVGHDPAGTEIEIVAPVAIAPDRGGRWAAIAAGETLRLELARGEIAQLVASRPPICDETRPGWMPGDDGWGWCEEPEHDLTGAIVHSSAPIAAFGGHVCANVPIGVTACDHLETTLAPASTWGTRFETAPLHDPESPVPNLLRIVAAHDGTAITTAPILPGLEPSLVLDRGEHVDVLLDRPVAIEGSRPIEVGQLLVGQDYTDPGQERGDPGLTILVPREQFRASYVFIAPASYTASTGGQSWILVTREIGDAIMLDGRAIDATWARAGELEIATVPVGGGAHRASADRPFGMIVFGLGEYTSYAFPAGLDLVRVLF